MTLTATLNTTKMALASVASQSAVVSRNLAGANDPNYSRKIASSVSSIFGGAQSAPIGRATDKALFVSKLSSTSANAGAQALSAGLEQLNATVGDTSDEVSPAALLSKFSDSISQYAADPTSSAAGQAVLAQATSLTTALNAAATTVQNVRTQADSDLTASVKTVNDLLAQFQSVNSIITQGTTQGSDVTDALDQRDSILSQLSEQIGITTITRPDNGLSIYTDSGVTLFEGTARQVTMTPSSALPDGQAGAAVYVDGVPVTGDGATMPVKSGKIQALATLRDTVAVSYGTQLNEIARGLVQAFAETDQSSTPAAPTAPGLFTYAGGPAMPSDSTGLAGSIKINASVDPSQGGVLTRLRDGGIADPSNSAYTYNTTGAAAFTGRLSQMASALSQSQTFNTGSGSTDSSLTQYATDSASWLQAQRKTASSAADYQSTLVSRATQALSSSTGVNLDDEMSRMLDLEHSYAASAKLISVVDNMYGTLFTAVGP